MLASRVFLLSALCVAILSASFYFLMQNYWFYLPGLLSYFTLHINPPQIHEWKASALDVQSEQEIEEERNGSIEERIKKHSSNKYKRPNIIFIVADDLGYNDVSFNSARSRAKYGDAHSPVPTPNIDSIAERGAAFVNGYAGHATCSPSRFSSFLYYLFNHKPITTYHFL